jgi:hypothetical protein
MVGNSKVCVGDRKAEGAGSVMPCGRADEPLREFSGVAPKPANASMRSKRDDRRQVQFVLGRGSKLVSVRIGKSRRFRWPRFTPTSNA